MINAKKDDILRSPAGLRYVVGMVEGDRVFLSRQLGIFRGAEIFEVSKEDLEEWEVLSK